MERLVDRAFGVHAERAGAEGLVCRSGRLPACTTVGGKVMEMLSDAMKGRGLRSSCPGRMLGF
jgi:hypothetical protein